MENNIIKHIWTISVMILFSTISFAQNNISDKYIEQGVEAFQNQDFDKAITYLSPTEPYLDELNEDIKAVISYMLGSCYVQTGDLNKARLMYEKVRSSSPSENSILLQVRPELLSLYTEMRDEVATSICLNEMLEMLNESEFIQSGFFSDYAISLSLFYQNKKEYQQVVDIATKGIQVIELEDDIDPIKGVKKNTLYRSLGNAKRELKEYESAAADYKEALNLVQFSVDKDSTAALTCIGNCYSHAGQIDSAIVYYDKAEVLFVNQGNPLTHTRIVNSLELGISLQEKDDLLRARQYLESAEKGFLQLGEKSELAYVYTYLYNISKEIGEQEQAQKYSYLIRKYIKDIEDDNNPITTICYSTYASILESDGKYEDAISLLNIVLQKELNEKVLRISSIAETFSMQSSIYMKIGDYVRAESAILRAIELIQDDKDLYKDRYIKLMVIYADILSKTNRIGLAISELENLNQFVAKAEHSEAAQIDYYSFLSYLYSAIGNYDQNLKYHILNSEFTLKTKGYKSYAYAVSLINLSESYGVLNQKDKSDECLNKAGDILISLYGEESKEYYIVLHKQTLKYINDSSTKDKGEKSFQKILRLSKKLFGEESVQYGENMCWYGMFRLYTMQDKSSLTLLQDGLNILYNIDGYDQYNMSFLMHLSTGCHYFKEYEMAYEADKKYFEMAKQYISANFPYLIDWQREAIWSPIQSHLFNYISAASETNSPLYLKLTYNSLLLGKGLLLQSTNNISEAIRQSQDIELLQLHNQLQSEKNKLLRTESVQEITDIRTAINSLQRLELNRLTKTDVLQDMFDLDWTYVRDALKEDEIAIEFISFPTKDCISYAALAINNNSSEPICVPLFNDKELIKLSSKNNEGFAYENPELYRLIWEPLAKYVIKDAQTVYFAPDGILHKLALESLVDQQGKLASDKWNLYRLTSTREIVHNLPKDQYKTAALFGGLKYSMTVEDLEDVAQLRSGVDYLAKTKDEVLDIQDLLGRSSVTCLVRTDELGTEEAFKDLSSKEVNILHLATHGFFWSESEEKEYNNLQFKSLLTGKDNKESALLRSGLMLSGANVTLEGKKVSDYIEDGILTAQEISSLDFGKMDLVVLSACQTGLGEISGDGVFGLQRGFKLAGVQALLMTLWKVNDTATQLLMTEFYKQMLQGNSKNVALKNAQKIVRTNPEFKNPEYWAGFVLLDGLN